MQVIEILKAHLTAEGFGGLVSNDDGCGCELGDLVPCGRDFSTCEPGYKHLDPRTNNPDGGPIFFAIWRQKEPPTDEQWEGVEY